MESHALPSFFGSNSGFGFDQIALSVRRILDESGWSIKLSHERDCRSAIELLKVEFELASGDLYPMKPDRPFLELIREGWTEEEASEALEEAEGILEIADCHCPGSYSTSLPPPSPTTLRP
jgi:hypothetical protein